MDPEAAPLVNSAEAPRPRRQGVQVAVALVLSLAGCVAVLESGGGRPQLLRQLKEARVGTLTERQALVNAISRAKRRAREGERRWQVQVAVDAARGR